MAIENFVYDTVKLYKIYKQIYKYINRYIIKIYHKIKQLVP